VSASEANHRLYGFDLHKEHPNVVRLVVHLKGRQTILFQEGTASTARPHATSVGTLSWQHFCKRLRSLCGMRLS
jgi:hypothetical protein